MFNKDKWYFRLPSKHLQKTVIYLTIMAVATVLVLTMAATNEIIVNDNGNTIKIVTRKTTVGKALNEANIDWAPEDEIDVDTDASTILTKTVNITRAFNVNIIDNNNQYKIKTAKTNVADVLGEANISLGEYDEVEPQLDAMVEPDSTIKLSRVSFEEKTEIKAVGYKTITENSPSLTRGQQKLIQEGKNGTSEVTYRITFKNGEEVSKEEILSKTIEEPINKVVAVGTRVPEPLMKLSSRGDEFRYKRAITCVATAYDASYETLGKHNPKTALGKVPTVGTVAVDTRIIPLGTRLYIESSDGGKSWVYGFCVAGDTGVRGYHVDLFKSSRSEALAFGRRNATVYILD